MPASIRMEPGGQKQAAEAAGLIGLTVPFAQGVHEVLPLRDE